MRGARLAALQTALLKAAAEEGFRRTLSFHHVVKEAEAFAAGLPDVAERVHAADPENRAERSSVGVCLDVGGPPPTPMRVGAVAP
ncbi:hypothetical protein [Streptomyces sp. NPDC006527]|uniref:hypothetical protein n=1 Tax=Streptomyces sp. NPDC006527 TaxID=3364749 RepID=UPI00369C55B4